MDERTSSNKKYYKQITVTFIFCYVLWWREKVLRFQLFYCRKQLSVTVLGCRCFYNKKKEITHSKIRSFLF